MNLGGPELLIVLAIVLVLFGGAKLPKLARSLGQAQKEFKKGVTDADDDEETSTEETPTNDGATTKDQASGSSA